jgi:hypothetical protein
MRISQSLTPIRRGLNPRKQVKIKVMTARRSTHYQGQHGCDTRHQYDQQRQSMQAQSIVPGQMFTLPIESCGMLFAITMV